MNSQAGFVAFISGAPLLTGTFCPSLLSLPSPNKIPAGFDALHLVVPQLPGREFPSVIVFLRCQRVPGDGSPPLTLPATSSALGEGTGPSWGSLGLGTRSGELLLPKLWRVGFRGATGAGLSMGLSTAEGFPEQGTAGTAESLQWMWHLGT